MKQKSSPKLRKQSQKSEGGSSVSVVVRTRAFLPHELEAEETFPFTISKDDEIVFPKKWDGKTKMTFDRVFGPKTSQENVYDSISPLVTEVLKGYSGTILAYGQTNSGKTYTMTGTKQAPGILGRVITQFFEHQSNDASTVDENVVKQHLIHVCMLEVYNERVRDLLRKARDKYVEVREHPDHGFFVKGLTKQIVTNELHALNILVESLKSRTVAKTSRNDASSRSHLLFTVSMEISTEEVICGTRNKTVLVSKMNLVDLAGSECLTDTVSKEVKNESKNINKSLTCLTVVINKLANREGHVPYRNSKLTMLLRDSLGGNSQTLMIATLSPCLINLNESINTLRYAQRTKLIKNKPNIKRNPKDAILQQLSEEVVALKKQVADQEAQLFSFVIGSKPLRRFSVISSSLSSSRPNFIQLQLDLRKKMRDSKSHAETDSKSPKKDDIRRKNSPSMSPKKDDIRRKNAPSMSPKKDDIRRKNAPSMKPKMKSIAEVDIARKALIQNMQKNEDPLSSSKQAPTVETKSEAKKDHNVGRKAEQVPNQKEKIDNEWTTKKRKRIWWASSSRQTSLDDRESKMEVISEVSMLSVKPDDFLLDVRNDEGVRQMVDEWMMKLKAEAEWTDRETKKAQQQSVQQLQDETIRLNYETETQRRCASQLKEIIHSLRKEAEIQAFKAVTDQQEIRQLNCNMRKEELEVAATKQAAQLHWKEAKALNCEVKKHQQKSENLRREIEGITADSISRLKTVVREKQNEARIRTKDVESFNKEIMRLNEESEHQKESSENSKLVAKLKEEVKKYRDDLKSAELQKLANETKLGQLVSLQEQELDKLRNDDIEKSKKLKEVASMSIEILNIKRKLTISMARTETQQQENKKLREENARLSEMLDKHRSLVTKNVDIQAGATSLNRFKDVDTQAGGTSWSRDRLQADKDKDLSRRQSFANMVNELKEARQQKLDFVLKSSQEFQRQNDIIRGLYSNIDELHKKMIKK